MEKLANIILYYCRLILFLIHHRDCIVHFNGLFQNRIVLLDGIVLNLIFKLVSSRYIYTAHNVLPHNKDNSRFYRWTYRLIYRIPDHLLVHTQLAKQHLIERFSVPERKITVISIGLNEEMALTDLTAEEARKRLGYQAGDKVILFFGKADAYKGLDTLIEAFDMIGGLPSTKLLVSGWFPDPAYRDMIMEAMESSPRREDILLKEGFIPNEEVEVLFKSADVLVLPYRNIYQSGIVFLCFHFGLPLVTTDVGSLREFVDHDTGIVTRTNDARGVSEALRLFFREQGRFRREEIVRNAKKFEWGNICLPLVPFYE